MDSIHILYASKLFNYHVFVFTCVLKKSDFHFKNSSFGKYGLWFKAKFQYHNFVFTWVLEKTVFYFKILVFGKYGFWFKVKFQERKNGSNCLKYVLNFCHTYLYFKDLIRTYFCGIYVYFMRFFRRQKPKFLISKIVGLGCLPVDRSGRRQTAWSNF